MPDEDHRNHAAGREAEFLQAGAMGELPPTSQFVLCVSDLDGRDVAVIVERLNRNAGAA
jgi:hypothetical protein